MAKTLCSVLVVAWSVLSTAGCSGPADPDEPDAAAIDAAAIDATVDAAVDAEVDAVAIDADPSQPRPILRYALDGDAANTGTLGPSFAGTATSTTWVPGKHGQAIRFEATQQSVLALPGTAGVFNTRPQLTIGLWFREDAVLTISPFVRYLLDDRCCFMQDDRGFQSYHGVSGAPLTTCSDAGCQTIDYTIGDWHHLLYRYDHTTGGAIAIYLDGARIATIANPGAIPIFGAGVADLRVGYNTAFTVDDLVVWDTVMTDADQCTKIVGGTWTAGACAIQ